MSLDITIPGFGRLQLDHLVSDYNGTLAVDGRLLPGVTERLHTLSQHLHIHVVTADTFGVAAGELAGLPVELSILAPEGQAEAKRALALKLGADRVAAFGNGRNDRLLLRSAALGIALLQGEGAAFETLASAHAVAPGATVALDLLLHPRRLTATLRS
ncbi:HAD family hydrolase [Xylophilus sp.]|uniref:HAD family hydrolase n=1 Tax=Xylophilus sp. TaxID=2653893 RepID=UPI0013BA01DE|nr:hypothetical protein [Xylophilus sp.]KAF1049474.1 MAG: hypothetical protein GAK38_00566 [Xylophilus sp.]